MIDPITQVMLAAAAVATLLWGDKIWSVKKKHAD
jgi:hypothetical protein